MNKKLLLFTLPVIALALLISAKVSDNSPEGEDWELPMKDGLIQIEYSDTFANKKKELCTYYTGSMLLYNVMTKTNNELSGKGGKLLSNTNYMVTAVLFNADASMGGSNFISCDASKNDTLMGSLTIMITKSSLKLGGVKNTFNTVKCRFKVILDGKNKMSIKFRGFTVSDSKYNAAKGGIQTTETDLEEIYKEFTASEKKKKSETDFFKDLRMIVDIFYNSIKSQMEKDIKVAEMD